jgi:hypothetical protein
MTTWSMAGDPARSSAPFAATAPRSMAEREARAPPGSPSPRLPPIHSAIGVRAPETMTMSGMFLVDKGLLLGFEDSMKVATSRHAGSFRS